MPRQNKIPNLEALAHRYGVTTRTLRRWKAAGADVNSLDSVAALLLRQRTPKSAALKSILSTYENDTKKRTAEN